MPACLVLTLSCPPALPPAPQAGGARVIVSEIDPICALQVRAAGVLACVFCLAAWRFCHASWLRVHF